MFSLCLNAEVSQSATAPHSSFCPHIIPKTKGLEKSLRSMFLTSEGNPSFLCFWMLRLIVWFSLYVLTGRAKLSVLYVFFSVCAWASETSPSGPSILLSEYVNPNILSMFWLSKLFKLSLYILLLKPNQNIKAF